MIGFGHLADVTGQCASGLNPNYDENGNFVSCSEGSPVQPNCVAGQQPLTFDDGSYGCSSGITAQSSGVASPNCNGGSPYLDNNGDWQCTAPPPPPSANPSGSAGMFMVAAAIAVAAYVYFANSFTKTYQSVSSGDPKQIFGSLT